MTTSSFLLTAALFVSAAGASAQSFTATTEPLGGAAATRPALAGTRYYTRSVAGGGSITYFGAEHTHDARHEQFAQLRQAFAASQPSVVFFENPDCGIDSTETATISRLGESGYVRLLAQQHRVPTARLDDPLAEYAYLQTQFEAEPLKLYYLMQTTVRLRANTSKAATVATMRALLAHGANFLPGTEHVIRTEAELASVYSKYCPAGGQWWQASAGWFSSPVATGYQGGSVAEAIDRTARAFREREMNRKLAEQAQNGQHVFVVLRPDHLPAPVLVSAAN